jgi:UDP-3-O-[3-hydroxymyristoyl] N-acetylglucosamine deacetylase
MGAMQIRGTSLVSGRQALVQFERREGPLSIGCPAWGTGLMQDAWRIEVRGHTTHLEHRDVTVATVEHLASALAGLGIYQGLHIELLDNEVPFLDGAAATFARTLLDLALVGSQPRLRVAKAGTVTLNDSEYVFESGSCVYVACELLTQHPGLIREAAWDGTRADYMGRIAPARTFLFEKDALQYLRDGVRAHVDPGSVVIIGEQLHATQPVDPSEPVRHKLLDLIGDLYLHGGPPVGRLLVRGPGHAATLAAMAMARERGIVVTV